MASGPAVDVASALMHPAHAAFDPKRRVSPLLLPRTHSSYPQLALTNPLKRISRARALRKRLVRLPFRDARLEPRREHFARVGAPVRDGGNEVGDVGDAGRRAALAAEEGGELVVVRWVGGGEGCGFAKGGRAGCQWEGEEGTGSGRPREEMERLG